ncbi:putative anion transporter 4, chloroplastic [Silene latifolia]|uniref:putative anion transporter 4, chloroplastic n=1 Tax=Silene latifolia TaxID=37657 RepID=UPI003D770D97
MLRRSLSAKRDGISLSGLEELLVLRFARATLCPLLAIAGGALVDCYGGKTVMGWGVVLWSLATFLTPWAAEKSLRALLFIRAMFSVVEGVVLPSMNNMISRWFPQVERARAVGLATAGFQLGSVIVLVLSQILMSKAGVFGPFVIFGLSGFLRVFGMVVYYIQYSGKKPSDICI